ncbi:MAG: hypothetical protein HY956_04990 [Deltaproteobacteria bacterium]|nr:hypothetical protein [Deltaproteobacteria bacterium]
MRRYLPVLFLLLFGFAGCAMPAQHLPLKINEYSQYKENVLEFSLFKSDQEVIGDEALNKILSSQVRVPKEARIAVLRLPGKHGGYFYAWFESFQRMQQEYIDALTSKLSSSERVKKVTVLPSLVMPKEASVPVLREAAVRLQADLLLVFQVNSNIFSEYNFLEKDKAKAYSTCEAVLIDVRSGVIPLTSIVTKHNISIQEKSDADMNETRARAEKAAILSSLDVVGDKILDFLKAVPEL